MKKKPEKSKLNVGEFFNDHKVTTKEFRKLKRDSMVVILPPLPPTWRSMIDGATP
jgi:hypothetical protein